MLTPDEIVQVSSGTTIVQLLDIVKDARPVPKRGDDKKSKTERFVEVLFHYSECLDVLTQSYAEYLCLPWGSVRFLMQVRWAQSSLPGSR